MWDIRVVVGVVMVAASLQLALSEGFEKFFRYTGMSRLSCLLIEFSQLSLQFTPFSNLMHVCSHR